MVLEQLVNLCRRCKVVLERGVGVKWCLWVLSSIRRGRRLCYRVEDLSVFGGAAGAYTQECISCCEGMVCNVEVPTNHTNAVFVIKQSRSSSGAMARTLSSAAFSLTFLTALLLS
ncbi:UNVERIFIED_CONTAM: hypothetical protein FKN15_041289 [Acipenser sinensis]